MKGRKKEKKLDEFRNYLNFSLSINHIIQNLDELR